MATFALEGFLYDVHMGVVQKQKIVLIDGVSWRECHSDKREGWLWTLYKYGPSHHSSRGMCGNYKVS